MNALHVASAVELGFETFLQVRRWQGPTRGSRQAESGRARAVVFPNKPSPSLPLQLSRHERGESISRLFAFVEDAVHFVEDGRLDVFFCAQAVKRLGGFVAFYDGFSALEEFCDGLSFSDFLSEISIAAPCSVARGHQIAGPTEAVKGFRFCAERVPDPRHFVERTGEQRRFCIITEAQSVAAARSDGINIFQTTAEFHAG